MANKEANTTGSGSRVLTILWLLVSAGLAYPVFTMLVSWGFNQALAGTMVFLSLIHI